MSNTGWAAVIVGLVVLLGLGWWMFSGQAPAPAATNTTVNATPGAGTGGAGDTTGGADVGADADVGIGDASTRVEIQYTASGFVPANITVAAGTAVTFTNETSGPMWVAADEHPTHTEYDKTDRTTHCSGSYTGSTPFDQCQTGTSYTFVFSKPGTFEYHNHSAPQAGGTITVR